MCTAVPPKVHFRRACRTVSVGLSRCPPTVFCALRQVLVAHASHPSWQLKNRFRICCGHLKRMIRDIRLPTRCKGRFKTRQAVEGEAEPSARRKRAPRPIAFSSRWIDEVRHPACELVRAARSRRKRVINPKTVVPITGGLKPGAGGLGEETRSTARAGPAHVNHNLLSTTSRYWAISR